MLSSSVEKIISPHQSSFCLAPQLAAEFLPGGLQTYYLVLKPWEVCSAVSFDELLTEVHQNYDYLITSQLRLNFFLSSYQLSLWSL